MIYIDDSIMEKGKTATAGSKILKNFTSPLTAAVLSRIGAKTERVALGEFGLEPPSGDLPAPLLCNDVFGYIRVQAAKQGLCCLRPTYGTVSRFGLIPTACSMDQIGVVCEDPREGFELLEKISGYDENDGAMFEAGKFNYANTGKPPVISNEETPYAGLYNPVFKILAYAEVCNNLSRYDGIKFGYRADGYKGLEDLYTKTRTEGFGGEAKLAAIMGCMVLSQEYYEKYYVKAMRLRRLIKESIGFEKFDVISLPVDSPLPQLTGFPSLTFGNVQLMADVFNERALLSAREVFL